MGYPQNSGPGVADAPYLEVYTMPIRTRLHNMVTNILRLNWYVASGAGWKYPTSNSMHKGLLGRSIKDLMSGCQETLKQL